MTIFNSVNAWNFKKDPNSFKNRTLISSPIHINPKLAQELLKHVNPVTLASTDLKGRMIQLWRHKSEFEMGIFCAFRNTAILNFWPA